MLDLTKVNPRFPDYCYDAVRQWGKAAQIDMVVEECAKLIDALQKFKRRRLVESAVISEAVDVRIMLTQLEIIFSDPETWRGCAENKIEHLREKLKIPPGVK